MNLSSVYADDTYQFSDTSLAYCTISSDGTITATSDALHQRVYDLISPTGTYSGTFTLTNPEALNDIYFYRSGNICNKNSAVGTSFSISSLVWIKCSNSNGSTCNLFDAFTFSPDIVNPNPVQTNSGYTEIESGNIVYFELGSGKAYDINLESQFYSKSGILSGTWSDDNRRYGFVNELPEANINFGETSGSGILWTKSSKGQNILGQTKIGDSNITGTTSGKYLWIINPMYNNRYFEDSLDAKSLNGLITVTGVPAGTTVYTYKLKQNASSIGLESTIPDVLGGTGIVSETTGTKTTYVSTDDNETPYAQTVGGDNSAPEEVTATEGIRQTLDQLSNSFSTLFLAPVEYIQNLISSGSAFMQTLGGIFNWLPEPVVSVFLSALILMIVIGVIKMLL